MVPDWANLLPRSRTGTMQGQRSGNDHVFGEYNVRVGSCKNENICGMCLRRTLQSTMVSLFLLLNKDGRLGYSITRNEQTPQLARLSLAERHLCSSTEKTFLQNGGHVGTALRDRKPRRRRQPRLASRDGCRWGGPRIRHGTFSP